jgi:hypothetical protein
VVISISRPLLAPHALLVAPPLVLDRDVAVDKVAKGLVLAHLQCLAKAVVKPRWNHNCFFWSVLVSSGAYRIIFMKWRSYYSTLITPWVMVRNSCAFWTSNSLGKYCSQNTSQNSSQVMNTGFVWVVV